MAFAKLYEPTPGRQILVKLDAGDAGPEVRIFAEPEGLGVCSAAFGFDDDDGGWNKAEKLFDDFDEEMAIKIADEINLKSALGGVT